MLRPLLALTNARSRSFSTLLEWLEPRQLLAAKVAAQVSFVETPDAAGSTTDTLQIVGTPRNDSIFITDDGKHAAGSLRITANGTQFYTNLHPLSTVSIATQTGNDKLLYELPNNLSAGPSETILAGSGSFTTSAIKGGGNLQMTVNLPGSIVASSNLSILAIPDRRGATTVTVNQSGVINGSLVVAAAATSSTPRIGPIAFSMNSTGTIGSTGSLTAGIIGGSTRNLLTANYTGTNNGDVTVIGSGSGPKDLLTANIQMTTGSTGTVVKSTPTQLTATGATPHVGLTVSRGTDSTSKTGINAQLATTSRRSVSIHTANVSTLASGKDSTTS